MPNPGPYLANIGLSSFFVSLCGHKMVSFNWQVLCDWEGSVWHLRAWFGSKWFSFRFLIHKIMWGLDEVKCVKHITWLIVYKPKGQKIFIFFLSFSLPCDYSLHIIDTQLLSEWMSCLTSLSRARFSIFWIPSLRRWK